MKKRTLPIIIVRIANIFLNHQNATKILQHKKNDTTFMKMMKMMLGYQAYFQRFLDFLLPLVNKPKTALDFGCGRSSLLASMLKKEGIKCDYYDPIYHPDTLDEKKKYELIVSTEVFEHLHQPREVFESLLKRLEEGGYLALQTQFHPNNIEAFKKWYYHQDPTHIVFFTAKTFKVLCKVYFCEFVADNGKNMVLLRKSADPRS